MLVTKINVIVAYCTLRQISILDHVIIYDHMIRRKEMEKEVTSLLW